MRSKILLFLSLFVFSFMGEILGQKEHVRAFRGMGTTEEEDFERDVKHDTMAFKTIWDSLASSTSDDGDDQLIISLFYTVFSPRNKREV